MKFSGIFGSAVDHQKFPNLKSIDLSNLADASFEGLTLFLEESQHLEFLRIIECSSVFHKSLGLGNQLFNA
uniref:Toll-like receptor 4 n=1 Tax=Ditylenchus dipsaci TaxID=166011 RepID=A0A915EK88_9BILA